MTNQQILEKAIQKAIDGGWHYPFGTNCYEIVKFAESRPESIAFGLREEWQNEDDPGHLEGHWSIQELIFNHNFAKALWGKSDKPTAEKPDSNHAKLGLYGAEGGGYDGYGDYTDLYFIGDPWQYHLQQMVIAEDPIKYLGENI